MAELAFTCIAGDHANKHVMRQQAIQLGEAKKLWSNEHKKPSKTTLLLQVRHLCHTLCLVQLTKGQARTGCRASGRYLSLLRHLYARPCWQPAVQVRCNSSSAIEPSLHPALPRPPCKHATVLYLAELDQHLVVAPGNAFAEDVVCGYRSRSHVAICHGVLEN